MACIDLHLIQLTNQCLLCLLIHQMMMILTLKVLHTAHSPTPAVVRMTVSMKLMKVCGSTCIREDGREFLPRFFRFCCCVRSCYARLPSSHPQKRTVTISESCVLHGALRITFRRVGEEEEVVIMTPQHHEAIAVRSYLENTSTYWSTSQPGDNDRCCDVCSLKS